MPIDKTTYFKDYYKSNKDKFKKYDQQKYHCDLCNKDIRKYYKKQHEETPLHLENKAKETLSGGDKETIKKALIESVEKLLTRIEKIQEKIKSLE